MTDLPVEGLTIRRGRSETVIHAPLEQVSQAMLDYGRYHEFMPHVRESRVVHRNRGATDLYVQVPLTPTLGVIWALLRLEARWSRARDQVEITGRAVDGNMERFEVHCLLERAPGAEPATRFVFEVLAQPRLPFPSSLFTRENRDASRTVASNVRVRVERAYALAPLRPQRPTQRTPSDAARH
ncbi:MAG: hypothetical protein HY909_19055 [Deltaproteobacteria bacterium]|nr:hypothetical protein [Deltaproteobacteria bacterium]